MYEIVGHAALLIVDMQHDFLDDDAPVRCADGRRIIPGIQQLAAAARQIGGKRLSPPGRMRTTSSGPGDAKSECENLRTVWCRT